MSGEAALPADSEAERMRATARQIFLTALQRANIEAAFSDHVEYCGRTLRICEDLYHLDGYERVFVLAIGKAAHSMAEALVKRIGPAQGIIASPVEPASQLAGFRYFHGGHPVPNKESLAAARAARRAVRALDENDLAIFLVSGGGSACFEQLVFDDETTLEDLATTYRVLVNSGASIAEINALRKHLSAVKGGRLAAEAAPAHQVSILVSDVPDDKSDALASGPTMPDSTTLDDCYEIAERYKLLDGFPAEIRKEFAGKYLHVEETPKHDDPAFVRSRWWTILSNRTLLEHAAAAAAQAGFAVEIDSGCDDWEYTRAADYLLEKLQLLRQKAARVCLISGGEVTVRVPEAHGIGGRNQQFALYCAEKITGENIVVLSAGSDGIDGNSLAAGAIADGGTLFRADAVKTSLAGFDAFGVFDSIGDTIVTGATGNNIRDLRILLAW